MTNWGPALIRVITNRVIKRLRCNYKSVTDSLLYRNTKKRFLLMFFFILSLLGTYT